MEKISKNMYKGELINNPMELIRLIEAKKSVYFKGTIGLIPAAAAINLPFRIIVYAITHKRLFYTHK